MLRGHADAILINGPELPSVGFPCVWEHKALGDKGWREIERNGFEKAYPQYAAQIWLYQAYLNVTDHPALFTAPTPIPANGFIFCSRSMPNALSSAPIVP
jgi:hypothetical protein